MKKFLSGLKSNVLVRKLIEGVSECDLEKPCTTKKFLTKPLANIYFQRDNFSSIGSCISINKMKYTIRQRENLLSELVFKHHPKFSGTKFVYSRTNKYTMEVGDIFPYSKDVLVIGISQRTSLNAVSQLAKNLKANKEQFKKIICINVPKVGRLMHLDT
jgi:arginine deiminase